MPEAFLPSRHLLSGRILSQEAAKAVEEMKVCVKGRYATGQSDAWKNIAKTSLVASMINVEYKVCDVFIVPMRCHFDC